jgi:hypothetical protein
MAKPKEQPEKAPAASSGPGFGGELARIIGVFVANFILLIVIIIVFSYGQQGGLPELNQSTLALDLLPVSAAFGLMLACRRVDLSLPMIFVLLVTLRSHPLDFFPPDPYAQLGVLCGVGGALTLISAMVTWTGRISSALWTVILGCGLWWLSRHMGGSASPGPWPWTATLAASLCLLAGGAFILGVTGLVSLPSLPPIIRTGAKGLVGLVGVWVVAGLAMGLAAQSSSASYLPDQPLTAYSGILAAGAMGGAFILRGRWGAVMAVILTSISHMVWFYIWSSPTASPVTHLAVTAGAPLAAIPLYLVFDRFVRRGTSESAPTGLMA